MQRATNSLIYRKNTYVYVQTIIYLSYNACPCNKPRTHQMGNLVQIHTIVSFYLYAQFLRVSERISSKLNIFCCAQLWIILNRRNEPVCGMCMAYVGESDCMYACKRLMSASTFLLSAYDYTMNSLRHTSRGIK